MPRSKAQRNQRNEIEAKTPGANQHSREVDSVLEGQRSSGRLHRTTNGANPQAASGLQIPAVRVQNEITTDEHLRVQREIEERAKRFWFTNGCTTDSALNNWLKAENEVLAEFVAARMRSRPMRPASLFRLAAFF